MVRPSRPARMAALAAGLAMLAHAAAALPAVPGDLDGNGRPSVVDAVLAARETLVPGTLESRVNALADLDQDGAVTPEDVVRFGDAALERESFALPTRVMVSPFGGEVGVAVTRETILELGRPLADGVQPDTCLSVESGGETLATHVVVDRADRRRIWIFYEHALPASARVRVTVDGDCLQDLFGDGADADADLIAGGQARVDYDTLTLTRFPGTRVCGRVLASELATTPGGETVDRLLVGAKITVDGLEDELFTYTGGIDSGLPGSFCLDDVPLGRFFVHVDGRTAQVDGEPGAYYPFVGKAWESSPGEEVNVGDIYLPLVPADALTPVSATEPTTIGFPPSILAKYADHPEFAQVSITVPPDALFADDGTRGGMAGIAPVPPDRIPGKLPAELPFPLVITVQTDGGTNFEQPVPACFPNLPPIPEALPPAPGSKSGLWSFNHDTGQFEIQGPMTVDETGKLVCTDPGVGIRAPGWHAALPSPQIQAGPIRRGPPPRPPSCPSVSPWDLLNQAGNLAKDVADCLAGLTGLSQKLNCLMAIASALSDLIEAAGDLHEALTNPATRDLNAAKAVLDALIATKDAVVAAVQTCKANGDPLSMLESAIACVKALASVFGFLCEVSTPPDSAPAICKLSPAGEKFCSFVKGLLDIIDDLEALLKTVKGLMDEALLAIACGTLEQLSALWEHLSGVLPPDGGAGGSVAQAAFEEDRAEALRLLDELLGTANAMADGRESPEDPPATEAAVLLPAAVANFSREGRRFGPLAAAARRAESLVIDTPVYFFADTKYLGSDHPEWDDAYDRRVLSSGSEYRFSPPNVAACRPCTPPCPQPCRTADSNLSVYRPSTAISFYDPVNNLVGGDPDAYVMYPAAQLSVLDALYAEDASTLPDTDGDGLADAAEWVVGSDPNEVDTDGDGVSDLVEAQLGSSPRLIEPDSIGIRSSVRTRGPAVDICALNHQVTVAEGAAGVEIFNVFLGLNPVRIAGVDTPGEATAVACSGRYVAVADGPAGLAVIDIVDPPRARIARQVDLGGVASCVAAAGPLAFVGTLNGTVWSVDLVTGAVLDAIGLGAGVHDLALAEDSLFALTTTGLVSLSYLDGTLAVAGITALPAPSGTASPRGRLHAGGGVVHAVHARGYTTVDVEDPAAMRVIASSTTPQAGWRQIVPNGSGLGVAVVNEARDFSGPDDVALYDVSDPAVVDVPVATHETPGAAHAASIYNGIGYIADGEAGMQALMYLPRDRGGIPPALELRTSAAGGGAVEGQLFRMSALVGDDVQVRNVEFIVDGLRVSTDGNFPFEHRFVTPLASFQPSMRLRARVTDTGGNATDSPEIVVAIEPDTTVPQVRAILPAPGSLVYDVPLVVAGFTEPMDGSSVPGGFIVAGIGPDRIAGNADDVPVAGDVVFRTDVLAAYFTPLVPLPPGSYVARVTTAVRDLAGNPILAPLSWTFHVVGTTDTDQDGLSDDVEALLGLDPARADTDGDGISDGNEDLDGDGLSNRAELIVGTGPSRADTDGDGVLDGAEDADGDGLTNAQEMTLGLDPVRRDTDGDGHVDGLEVALGSDPFSASSKPKMLVFEDAAPSVIRPVLPGPGLGSYSATPHVDVVVPDPDAPGIRGTTYGQPPTDVERP